MSDENQIIEEQRAALRKAAEPLIKYLAENHHPHVKAIVTSSSVELVEGVMSIPDVTEFIRD